MTVLSALRGIRNAGIESPAVPLTSTTLLDLLVGPKSAAGVTVTEKSALGMPAVWRAVNLIAGSCAALPLHAYKRDGEKRIRQNTGAAADLLADPHPDMTPFELWELAYGSIALWGNAYFKKLYNQLGQLAELWWINPARVRTNRAELDGTKVYVIDGDTDNAKSDKAILHIPGFGYDGVCGVSPIRAARQGIGLALAAEDFGARLFGSGSLASGILQTEQRLTVQQANEIKERWKAGGTGMDSAHDIRVLGSGASFQQLTIPPEDAQFLESRRFQVTEIARMFGVPPHMLMETDRSTSWGSGIESQNIAFVQYTLQPWLTRVEQRLTKMLRPQSLYVKYSIDGLLRGDSAQRGAFYTQLWNLGVLSTNDIRRLEDMDPIGPEGDVRYRPLNMGVLGTSDTTQSEVTDATQVDDPAPAAA